MKKWFVFLLALIVIAGSVTPCCTEDDCQDEQPTSSSKGESHEEGNCSPFFACATCAGFVQVAKPVQVPQSITARPLHHEKIIVFVTSTYYSSFFQPPRSC